MKLLLHIAGKVAVAILVAGVAIWALTGMFGESKGLAASRTVVEGTALGSGAAVAFIPYFFSSLQTGYDRVSTSLATPKPKAESRTGKSKSGKDN